MSNKTLLSKSLVASKDTKTGQVFFPPRKYSVDGKLRELTEFALGQQGILYSWTQFAGIYFGQIDMPEGVRIQTQLDQTQPVIGTSYEIRWELDDDNNETWRFVHV